MITLEQLSTIFSTDSNGKVSMDISGGLRMVSSENVVFLFSDVEGGQSFVFPKLGGRFTTSSINELDGDPTGNEVPNNTWGIFRNLATGDVRIWINDNGVLKYRGFKLPQL